jgi:hypothetical protein
MRKSVAICLKRAPSFFLLDIGPQQIDSVLELAETQGSVSMIETACHVTRSGFIA